MRSFKKILVRIVILAAFLIVFDKAVRFVYQSPGENIIYTKNDLKESKGEVETLILGTSLAHWGVNGGVLGELLDSTTFNLATSAQPLEGSYYFLRQQLKDNPLERVFLGVHATSLINNYDENTALKEGIFDRLSSPLLKAEYLLRTADTKEYEQYLFYAARVENVMTWEKAKRYVKYKLSDDFRNNIPPEGQKMKYMGMGDENTQAVYDGSFDDESLGDDAIWAREKVYETNEIYLQKIADLCSENGVELNLFVTPMTWEFTRLMGDLDDMHEYLEEFAEKNNANLFDANQYEGIYEIFTDDCYQDKKHFNAKGAEKFSELLAKWYQEQ
ncbi:MAG: hypothetical protein Q4C91_01155 [Eubacteriales bacterium]|nr:hypothetical protein [Eubacteriales bacterium]